MDNKKMHEVANDGEWTQCPTGTLTSVSAKVRRTARRQKITKVIGVGGSVCALLIAAVLTIQNLDSSNGESLPKYGGLACATVIGDMSSFLVQELESDRERRIRKHLEDCPSCRNKYEQEAGRLGLSPSILAYVDSRHPINPILASRTRDPRALQHDTFIVDLLASIEGRRL